MAFNFEESTPGHKAQQLSQAQITGEQLERRRWITSVIGKINRELLPIAQEWQKLLKKEDQNKNADSIKELQEVEHEIKNFPTKFQRELDQAKCDRAAYYAEQFRGRLQAIYIKHKQEFDAQQKAQRKQSAKGANNESISSRQEKKKEKKDRVITLYKDNVHRENIPKRFKDETGEDISKDTVSLYITEYRKELKLSEK